MSISRLLNVRTFAFVIVALVLATVTYGFAASNTVPESGAGDGAATISGYEVTGVAYSLDALDPSSIDSVSFQLTPSGGAAAATEVQITLVQGGSWIDCDASLAPTITCDVSAVTVASVDELRVVAVQ